MSTAGKFNLAVETLWVTLVRGGYWRKPHWEIAALRNLGLVHTNQVVEVENNPQNRGNIEKARGATRRSAPLAPFDRVSSFRPACPQVKHLVQVETSEMLLKRLEAEVAKRRQREPVRVLHNRTLVERHLWSREWKIPDMRGRPAKVWGKTMV